MNGEELMAEIDECLEAIDEHLKEQIVIDNILRDIKLKLEDLKAGEETITPDAIKTIEKKLKNFEYFQNEAKDALISKDK